VRRSAIAGPRPAPALRMPDAPALAVVAAAMASTAQAAEFVPWRANAPPLGFLFGIEFDGDQQSACADDGRLAGHLCSRRTGVVTRDRQPMATRHRIGWDSGHGRHLGGEVPAWSGLPPRPGQAALSPSAQGSRPLGATLQIACPVDTARTREVEPNKAAEAVSRRQTRCRLDRATPGGAGLRVRALVAAPREHAPGRAPASPLASLPVWAANAVHPRRAMTPQPIRFPELPAGCDW
jgi:hypothetical protein